MYINVCTILLFTLIWAGIVAYLRVKKKKSVRYVLLFTIFYIYLFKVLDYTLFQFQTLLLLKQFMPNLMLRGQEAGKTLNLIPLATLTADDIKTSLLNILLFVPFGLGLPFITKLRMKKIVVLGAVFSVGIEALQFVTGLAAGISFRVADMNDVIFNTAGAAIGYVLFAFYLRLSLQYIADR